MTTVKTKFSEHITALFRNHPNSISSLCKKMPVSRMYMYTVMGGSAIPSRKIVDKVMNVLDLSDSDREEVLSLYSEVEKLERPRPEQPRIKDNLERISSSVAENQKMISEIQASVEKIQEQLMTVVWMQGKLAGYDKE